MRVHHLFTLLVLPGCFAVAQQTPTEMETKEAPAKFTSKVNLVPVTVVVRDREGHAVGNLTKADFSLRDNGKLQVIARFSVEKPGTPVILEKEAADPDAPVPANPPAQSGAAPPVLANHFVAYLFDDIHTQFEDLVRARDGAAKVIAGSMQPAERAAIFTTSGKVMLEFTADKEQLQQSLARLRPSPVTGGAGHNFECPDISYYMADKMINYNDQQAIQVALANYIACSHNQYATAQEVMMYAQRSLSDGEHETRLAESVLAQVVRRMSALPGQRSIVLASPGFVVPVGDQSGVTDVINRAIRANVIISTLDARGLWTPPEFDASRPTPAGGAAVITLTGQYMQDEAQAMEFVLQDLAHATGGEWFHSNNDLSDGFRRLAAAPEYIYVLGFTPENLKSDGKYHKLQIALRDPKGLTLQARKGYYAPKHEVDAEGQAKQELEDAVFSREVIKDIPLSVHTQFFRSGDFDAKVSIVSQLDIKNLHYKKEAGRNDDILTIVSALFDLNGNLVAGEQKVLTLKLKDETLEKRLESGIKIKSSFDVKTGSYAVRVVVRDTEGQMMAAENIALDIQ